MSVSQDRVQVVIPALNEEVALPDVIKALQKHGFTKIRVVDNGSIDQTAEVARQAGAEVIPEPQRGYGQACWTGTQNLAENVDWLLFCDADGSDDLDTLPLFLEAAPDFDFILANRRAKNSGRSQLTPVQNFGNALSGFLIQLGWGQTYHDLGPLRLIRRSSYEAIEMQDRGFGWTVEMQARAAELNLRTKELPSNYFSRKGGQSKISGTVKGSAQAGAIILSTLGTLFLRKSSIQTCLKVLSSLLILVGCWMTAPHGDFRQPGEVASFLQGICVFSLGFVLCWAILNIRWWHFWGIVLASRFLLFPMYPGDDIWRYLWEGMIQLNGICPYLIPPADPSLIPLHTPYWELINHGEVAAIYPPVAQIIFKGLAALSDTVAVFKLAIIFADLGICWLLVRSFGLKATLIYAWNPLVIYNFAGGAHYDSLFLLPLVGAWLAFRKTSETTRRKWILSAILLGLSIGIKWITAPIAGFLCWRAWREESLFKGVLCGIAITAPFILTLAIVCSGVDLRQIQPNDFALYARSAELVPRLVGNLWEGSRHRNWIFAIPLTLVSLVLIFRSKRWVTFSEWFLFCLLTLSPAIHAWYFTWLVPFAVSTRNLGTRWLSITVFIYFLMQHRKAVWQEGDPDPWYLTQWELAFLWTPFLLGFLLSFRNRNQIYNNEQ
ncbi:MAG: glycosyltransferase [Verrucomicrobiota bacterium]